LTEKVTLIIEIPRCLPRGFFIAILALAPFGCAAPEEQSPPPVAETPELSTGQKLIAQDEVKWKAVYNRIMKDFSAKLIPKKLTAPAIAAAKAVAEKDSADLDAILTPRRYTKANRALLDGFRALQSGYLYSEMGLQTGDRETLESGRKELLAAVAFFNEARAAMQKATPKPTPTPRPKKSRA